MNRHSIMALVIFIIIMVIAISPITALEIEIQGFENELTSEELTWIEANRDVVIDIASVINSDAIFYYNDEQVSGVAYELISNLSRDIDLKFNFVLDNEENNYKKLNDRIVELMISEDNSAEIDEDHIKTKPIISKPYWVCSNSAYQSVLDLRDQKIGFMAEKSPYSAFLKVYSTPIDPQFFSSQLNLFHAVFVGEVDAIMIADSVEANRYINTYGLDRNFVINDVYKEYSIIANKEQEILLSIIEKYIEYSEDEIKEMNQKSNDLYIRSRLDLPEKTDLFLREYEEIKVGYMTNFLPFDYSQAGNMKGISSELLNMIGNVLGKKLTFISYDNQLVMEQALHDGRIDIVTSYGIYKNDLDEDFIQSMAYTKSNVAVLGYKNNDVLPHRLNDLAGTRIALVKGSWQEKLLDSNLISYTPVYVESIHDAMNKVNDNDADYIIENQWVLNYLMNEMEYDNLRPSGAIAIMDYRHFLFRKSDVRLCKAINEVLKLTNLKAYENVGLYEDYQIQPSYEFYEILTVTLFLTLCFIGIYIAFLINRLNMERQKAETANRSKSEFLAKMSHEIRTPLTAIMGYINLLSRSEHITGKEKQQLKIAYNSSSILIHLVNDILDFSKIEAGKVNLVEQDFNLKLMINNAVNIIGVMAEEKKLDFSVKLHQKLPNYINGDERRLEQILINILSNSVKFTDQGRVELIIVPEFYQSRVRLNFKIRDTGKGMKAETINMIFEAFEQEDNSISRRYGGTGLGLYISKDFIERMGGEIKVNSDVGKGTTFEFYTVHKIAQDKEDEDEVGISLTIDEIKGMKVLLVEDNDINQMIIRDILMDMGMKVIITNNGAEALEAVNDGFSFVMMDIRMPVMNGLDAIGAMRNREDLDGVPIIALTANVMPEQIDSYYKAGFDAYCSKPIMIDELAQTLLQMYERYHMNKDK